MIKVFFTTNDLRRWDENGTKRESDDRRNEGFVGEYETFGVPPLLLGSEKGVVCERKISF